jgi:DNA-binding winged helix-turn-helix (wHTH) protein/Tol biopolymer transport system component
VNSVATGFNGTVNGSRLQASLPKMIRFGVYEVDPVAGELRREGIKVRLQEQPFQILAMLLERPGEIVSREELQRRLWPADTFVDFDHSLNAAIKRLRDALRDSADNPRFVETLARRGYRFVAPVAKPVDEDGTARPEQPAKRSFRVRWLAAALVLAAGCISIGWHVGHRTAAQPVVARETRLTYNSQDVPVLQAALSPDARLLAYIDPRGVFLREVAREDSHQLWLPNEFKANSVAWFPDGNHVLVGGVAKEEEKPSLWNVSILGGAPRKVSDKVDSGAISPDGTKIAFLRGEDKVNSSELWLMNADGSQSRKLAGIGGYSASLAWSPSSRRLAYTVCLPGKFEYVQIDTYDFSTGKTATLYSDDLLEGGLSWGRDGRLFFTRDEPSSNSESNVWAIRVNESSAAVNGKPERVTSGPDWKPHPEISADGKHLMFLRTNIAPTIYVADIDPKGESLQKITRLTLDESRSRPYEWTPDGKALLYISDRYGQFHIFRQRLGEASPDLLVDGPDEPRILRLNPDASEILYLTAGPHPTRDSEAPAEPRNPGFERQKQRILRAPIAGGAGQPIVEADGINNFQCARAPSHMCLYSRYSKDGFRLVQFDAVSGAGKEVWHTSEPGWEDYNWSLSPDGKLLALCRQAHIADDTTIRLISLEGGAERPLRINAWVRIVAFDWAADGKSFWASAVLRGETRAMVNIDLRGDLQPVVQDDKPYVGWAIPSRDGKRLAMWQSTGGSNAWMLEGF